MKTTIGWSLLVAAASGIFAFTIDAASTRVEDGVDFPEGYRSWTHISSAVIQSGASGPGMHHIYANARALEGYRTGNFPNGSIIVFDRFALDVTTARTKAGARQFVNLMVKDSARFRTTGGWGYDGFTGDSRTQHLFPQSRAVTSCFNCHAQRKDSNFVFTSFTDANRATR
ncbi:MAG: cytochrome P460 family protein [Gemmatimonas sp.]